MSKPTSEEDNRANEGATAVGVAMVGFVRSKHWDSLAASPSLPGLSYTHAEGEEGLANFALDHAALGMPITCAYELVK